MTPANDDRPRPGLWARLRQSWGVLWRPSARFSLGTLMIAGIATGVIGWGGFNWAMELTNTETFCISCHEMQLNVYREFKGTVHDNNKSGVRATCPDCHVPREWVHKLVRKVEATNELYHTFLVPSIDTREKFEAKRLQLATNVWTAMKRTDSRECRNCHNFDSMDFGQQRSRARNRHLQAQDEGKTCIDCHKGVAHKLPAGAFGAERELEETWGSGRRR
ncbi:MAG: Denitrification system component NirT [Alphaproteobacteria bacterium]|nr:Denitrification system component NirT [Alphaproteobacteria bacterium]